MELQIFQGKTEEKQQVENYLLENTEFTAHPKELIGKDKPERALIKIIVDQELVGFFALDENAMPEFCGEAHLVIRALSISEAHRRKYYAKEALEALPAFVGQHFPKAEVLILAVNHANENGQKLYQKVGFHDTTQRKIGKLGEQFIFKKALR